MPLAGFHSLVSAPELSSWPSTDVTAPESSSGVPSGVTPVQTTSASGPSSTKTTVLTATQRKSAISSPSLYLSPSTSYSVSSDLHSLASSECIAGGENTGYQNLKWRQLNQGLIK